MRLPATDEVVDYARRVFAVMDELTSSMSDDILLAELPGDPDHDSTGQNVVMYMEHISRHLGMIEAMKGRLGLIGTASR